MKSSSLISNLFLPILTSCNESITFPWGLQCRLVPPFAMSPRDSSPFQNVPVSSRRGVFPRLLPLVLCAFQAPSFPFPSSQCFDPTGLPLFLVFPHLGWTFCPATPRILSHAPPLCSTFALLNLCCGLLS